ncbi:phosphoribosylaminoimidazolesuccinocarboxamide synthase [Vaginisenegalia massiliensis]|uniref:phosphoribosylaminoimidazolesuccinocarboxamide synthase n=1 Tax=Vaginisenegalia massiliensis TaxID=2058294 RepID=UPI000F53F6F6|nr:phosphoribosylaminoimidazolesuccinocarboxamide synthase [Vaginisenegalia massiliensis]
MKKLYQGKTKDVFELDQDHVRLLFKDDMTGKDGVFDPGENQIGLTVEGSGRKGLALTQHFFAILEEKGVKTHFVGADLDACTMDVKKATIFGKGLEVVCRYRAVGSFLRRYGAYCQEGQVLDSFVEVTLKDDGRQDPPITKDALVELDILTAEEYETIKQMTKDICQIIKDELAKQGIELYDIKLEFGRQAGTQEILLIDEISGGNMRAYENGQYLDPFALTAKVLGE